jgi:hypothetical protein
MIQRIQTLYLLIAFALGIVFLFSPLASFSIADLLVELNVIDLNQVSDMNQAMFVDTMPLIIVDLAFVVLMAVSILMYKNRPLQIKMVGFGFLMNTVIIILGFWYTDTMADKVNALPDYEYGAIIPVISLIFLFMAMRGIRKDTKLIKSMERLR